MKYFETKFEEYVSSCGNKNLHPEIVDILEISINAGISNNLIFYGPPGTGKYTQALNYIKNFSATKLKYERKMNIYAQKNKEYMFKISDIHFEIDMELLGCNAKVLWNEIYKSVLDILSTRPSHEGIIVCKNFQKIHNELLDIFYSYMQSISHKNIKLSFIFITESISFIPDNILKRCKIISIKRPTKSQYKKCIKGNITCDISNITNIKDIISNNNRLYDIFIYHLDLNECIWEIIKHFVKNKSINGEKLEKIQTVLYDFLKLFNNNYRPIYHLERFMFYLCKTIHEF
jgi:DNA polymerase III delta prime subunit